MTPVVGLDVAKGATEGQAFLAKDHPYGPHFAIIHTMAGFAEFEERLQALTAPAGCAPVMILESTGPYHVPVVRFLEDHGYAYILLNPLVAHQAKQGTLRKVKTDAIDAYRLGNLFYKEDLEPARQRGQQLPDLRLLTRQHEAITGLLSHGGRRLGRHAIGGGRNDSHRLPHAWAAEKAQQLQAAAERNPLRTADLPHQAFSLRLSSQLIAEHQAHLATLDREIDALVQDIEACQLIQSIPGIGTTLAATIIAEIGEMGRFADPKKLVAFAGVDPRVHQSGQFTATVNRITKRGSSRLRHALFVAAMCGLRKLGSKRMQAVYQAKRAAGKPHKVALVACINKLLHWIYAIVTRRQAFVDIA